MPIKTRIPTGVISIKDMPQNSTEMINNMPAVFFIFFPTFLPPFLSCSIINVNSPGKHFLKREFLGGEGERARAHFFAHWFVFYQKIQCFCYLIRIFWWYQKPVFFIFYQVGKSSGGGRDDWKSGVHRF